MKKIVQIFQEDGGKFSSKRVWGGVVLTICGIAFVLDGLHFYEINNHLFDSFLLAGTTMVGLGALTKFAKK